VQPAERPTAPLKVLAASPAERQAHEQMLAVIGKASGGQCLWPASVPPESAA
jgi:hypothetical protein